MVALNVAVGQLNASVGNVVSADQLASALRAGSVHHLSSTLVGALINSIFAELPPDLILRSAAEAGADVHAVDRLYRATLADALPPSPRWERAVEPFL
jgi:hypothetical protein